MNIETAKNILRGLKKSGVRTLCLCPGARNAPFIELLSNNKEFELISFYDERSAGFFALGRAQKTEKPVAVLTTSGTAVSELFSSVIEAHYTHAPLVVLSSDRPKRLRGSGAPQAIEQANIFQNFVENSFDFQPQDNTNFNVSLEGPTHINCCFDEPLVDEKIDSWTTGIEEQTLIEKSFDEASWSQPLEKTIVVVGRISKNEASNIEKQLSSLEVPIFAEAASGLRGSEILKENLLWGGEKIVSKLLKSGEIKNVVRIGDVPLGRYWRDLDQLNISTLSLSSKNFSGTEKSQIKKVDLKNITIPPEQFPSWDWAQWKSLGFEKTEEVSKLIQKYPKSEVSLFSQLANRVSANESIYIGNSLPVREWDLVEKQSRFVSANRGANGIDGQISSAFGSMGKSENHWVILGDLTTLYDFNGFWVTPYLMEKNIQANVVVINNGGGQIFSRIFENPLFRNEHNLNFKSVADQWAWEYSCVTALDSVEINGLQLIEVRPNREQTQSFWQEYDQLWK